MDENSKKEFRWKFYHLTAELNIIILLAAMSVPLYLIVHTPYTLPVIIVMLAIALILSLDFVKRYRGTRAWLDIHGDQEKESATPDVPAGPLEEGFHDREDEG